MKVVQLKNGLLIKRLISALFIVFTSQALFAQDGSELPSIDVSVNNIQYIEANEETGDGHFNVMLDFDFDFGTSIPLNNIEELGFDIKLGSVGFEDFYTWTIPNHEILICNGGFLLEATQNDSDPRLYHIKVSFAGGILEENTCRNNLVASVGIIVEGTTSEPDSFATFDCYDSVIDITTTIETTNNYVKFEDFNNGIELNEVYYEEEFEVSYCSMPPIENQRSYDVNLVISDFTNKSVSVDVYFRYTDNTDNDENLSIIRGGWVRVSYNSSNFFSPSLEMQRASLVNTSLHQGGLIIFDWESITGSASTPIYLGTLIYNLKAPDQQSDSRFSVEDNGFTDQWGPLASNVKGVHDEEFYYHLIKREFKFADTDKNEEKYINVSPSPAKNIVKIETNFDLDESLDIVIYDTTGKKISQPGFNFDGYKQIQMDVQSLNKGIYLVVLTNKSNYHSAKILKE